MLLHADSVPHSDVRRDLMDAAIIAVDSDTSTTTVTISRSMEVTSSPVIDVNVGPSLIDGTPTETTIWRCWSSVASSGVSRAVD